MNQNRKMVRITMALLGVLAVVVMLARYISYSDIPAAEADTEYSLDNSLTEIATVSSIEISEAELVDIATEEEIPEAKKTTICYIAIEEQQKAERAAKEREEAAAEKAEQERIAAEEAAKKQAQVQTQIVQTTYALPSGGLTPSGGVNDYEGHRETYYNLDMSRVVSNAQNAGIEGQYWVRDDGVKMFGDKVIVAANQELYPYGTTVDTSLGEGIVLDTGTFVNTYPEGYDIATDW